MKKIIPLVLLSVVAIGILLSNVQKIWNRSHLKLSGTLELTEHSLGARVAGRLGSLSVDEGSEVKQGQQIATLDRYEQLKRDYDRAEQLYKQGGVDHQALELAKLALEDQEVTSPVDGTVLVKVREAGEVLSAGAPVAVVGDRKKLWVRVFVPEGVINRVKLGQAAKLTFDGIRREFKGHVDFVAPQAEFTPRNVQTPEERITQTFAVKVMLDEDDGFLRPGVSVDVSLDLKEPKH